MKTLEMSQMANLNGGDMETDIACGVAFIQFGGWISYAVALAGVTAGAGALIGVGIGAIGLATCVYNAYR